MNRFWSGIKHAINGFENSLYPEYSCMICGREARDSELLICENCKEKLISISGNLCTICGVPLPEGNTRCDDCKANEIYFDKAVARYIFDELSAKLVYGLKYSGDKFAAKHLALMLIEPISSLGKIDTIIPVPLHENRKLWRGYNQSELIAESLSEITSIELDTNSLERHIETEPQQGKGRIERQANLVGAFRVGDKEKVKGKNILLIDDVYTTGTTVNECARVLKRGGAEKVFVATVLKVVPSVAQLGRANDKQKYKKRD